MIGDLATEGTPARAEHESLISALQQMEGALVVFRGDAQDDWRAQADAYLAEAAESIQAHCRTAESPDGLLTEVEREAGHSSNVESAQNAHHQLCDQAGILRQLVRGDGDRPRAVSETIRIIRLLKRHLDLQGDLVYDAALESESGVGD